MNTKDRIIVAILFCLLIGWSFYGRKLIPQPPPPETPAVTNVAQQAAAPADTAVAAPTPPADPEPEETVVHAQPEQSIVLTNDLVRLVFSSWGGGITSAELSAYPATMEKDSGPVVLDFSERPALSLAGMPDFSTASDFEIQPLSRANSLAIRRENATGLSLSRVVALTNGYVLAVTDTFRNNSDEPLTLAELQMSAGPMANIETKASTRGISYLGVDSLGAADKRVAYWGKKLNGLFGVRGGCSRPNLTGVPLEQTQDIANPLTWVAVKNKFFAQVLDPSDDAARGSVLAQREDTDARFTLSKVSAGVFFPPKVLQPGESIERATTYYVGPKRYSELQALGNKQGHIMMRAWKGWGWWRHACIGLLWLLNAFWFVTRNYGIAIILLTIVVKIVFWPLTHKGTENMKKMQKLQPQLAKLREKLKDNPKKLQEKQMLLYRENGVNPLAGCLPMFVQMPVFIALFTVLRSAVELRFASILWIADLSEPEGLLAGVLPFPASGLNLLPLAMTGTMILQQRLTPSAGDPQQQKMMQFMPLMMLFIFYNMASALVLYWTVSQLLSIVQLVMQQRKEKVAA